MPTAIRVLLAALLCACAVAAPAETPEEADLREEIILRCYYEMGEFGTEGVARCMEADTAAVQALSTYPEHARPIIDRCTRHTRANGWARVKLCVDQDLAAEAALAAYGPEHAGAIEQCRAEAATRGAAKVKACVDRRIAGQPPEGNR